MKFSVFSLAALMFAQTTIIPSTLEGATSSSLGEWGVLFVITVIGVKAVLDLYKEHIKPKDHEPPLHKEFASIAALDELDADVTEFIRSFEAWKAEDARAGKASRKEMYDLIRKMENQLPAIGTRLDQFEKLLTEARASIELNNRRH